MSKLGSPNYRVGLIIAKAQPFHNGHLKIIADALMVCDEVIFSIMDYDTAFFNYDINQALFRELFKLSERVAFFGTTYDPTLGIPKHFISKTLAELETARYNMPTHFFTNYADWVTPAMECQLLTTKVSTLPDHNSTDIYKSIEEGTDFWKDKVPYATIESIETYIATKRRNF